MTILFFLSDSNKSKQKINPEKLYRFNHKNLSINVLYLLHQ